MTSGRTVHLDDLERVPLAHGSWWPVRRALGITGFGVNAYSADAAGDDVIEPHDERSPGAGGHEERYLVATRAAAFTVDGERIDAWPDHPRIHDNLACLHARAGDREPAVRHLRIAAEHEPEALAHATTDPDLDAIPDDPDFPRPRA